MEQIIKKIMDLHGPEILRNGAELADAFAEFATQQEDIRLFWDFVDIQGHIALFDAKDLPLSSQVKCYEETVSKLVKAVNIPEHRAQGICAAFWRSVHGSPEPPERQRSIHQKRKNTAAAAVHGVRDSLKSIGPLYAERLPVEQSVIGLGGFLLAGHFLFFLLLLGVPQNRLPAQFKVLEIIRILLILLIQYRILKKGLDPLFPAPAKRFFPRLLHWLYRIARKGLMGFFFVTGIIVFVSFFSIDVLENMEVLMGGLSFLGGIAGILCWSLAFFDVFFFFFYLAITA